MKNLFKLICIMLIAVNFLRCTKNFDEINTDPKALTLQSLDQSSYGFVVRKAIYGAYWNDQWAGSMQILHSLYFDIYANYFATTAENFLSDRYVMVGRWLDGDWETFYANDAPQVKYAVDFARQKNLQPEFGMMKIWQRSEEHTSELQSR